MRNQTLFDVTGKTVFVTGASSGIGKAAATCLAECGAKVVAIARRENALKIWSQNTSGLTSFFSADISNREKIKDIVSEITSKEGDPDILINAAGLNTREHADDVTLDGWNKTLDLNLSTPFFMAQAVVEKMKETNAIIGGEGNGGIIYPELHYGRDALVGIALFLTQLAERKISAKTLRDSYPNYFISKNKIQLTPEIDIDNVLSTLVEKYEEEQITTIDGLKIDFEDGWAHLRKSNTEPIIRIYAESEGEEKANSFAEKMINEIKELI